ncbi:MAG: tRNA (adenine-N1)-methyltransferase [Actinomycetaceae bacterium]|nr:tRNA (adenine-N1)-methyltransferase [Actinomycetaceae bacterium]
MNNNHRRGPFRPGDRVQLTDSKGRMYTVTLAIGGHFHSSRGSFDHDDLIGQSEGSVIDAGNGRSFVAFRPLLSDYVLSMPRGATVIYPKDAAQITYMADIFPGARVYEAGVGSGALTIALLNAVGTNGRVYSAELRSEFAEIAKANVQSWFGVDAQLPWNLSIGDAKDIAQDFNENSFDHVVYDMLDPWNMIEESARLLRPGGVFLAYVATTTQMSRLVETLRESGYFTDPQASETLVRTWHLEGLSVRPDHRMVAHTGFLVQTRRMAQGVQPLVKKSRPAKLAYSSSMQWEEEDFDVHTISPKKLRKVRRDVALRSDVEETGHVGRGERFREVSERIEKELRKE